MSWIINELSPEDKAFELVVLHGRQMAYFIQEANIEKLKEYKIFSDYEDKVLIEIKRL